MTSSAVHPQTVTDVHNEEMPFQALRLACPLVQPDLHRLARADTMP